MLISLDGTDVAVYTVEVSDRRPDEFGDLQRLGSRLGRAKGRV